MKKTISILSLLLVLSCYTKNEKKIEYYENGNIKSIHYEKNGLKDGKYRLFYNNDILKELHIYNDGKRVDSSIYFFPPPNHLKLKRVIYWENDFSFQTNYAGNGNKVSEGMFYSYSENRRIGKWNFYGKNKDSIVEYLFINKKPYINQFWVIKPNKDTLYHKSNYYRLTLPDTITLGEIARVRVELLEPYYNYNTDIEVVLPTEDSNLLEDFSNLGKIERDTIYSLKNDNIPHPEVPKEVPQNQVIEFGLDYGNSGKKRIRGVLVEYYERYKGNDSIQRIERRLFFDETIYVKE